MDAISGLGDRKLVRFIKFEWLSSWLTLVSVASLLKLANVGASWAGADVTAAIPTIEMSVARQCILADRVCCKFGWTIRCDRLWLGRWWWWRRCGGGGSRGPYHRRRPTFTPSHHRPSIRLTWKRVHEVHYVAKYPSSTSPFLHFTANPCQNS